MTKLYNSKNQVPIYVEQKNIQTDLKAEEILKTKTVVPSEFIRLETETGNYCGSTNLKWKNKPLCERYGFSYEGEWIQIDIPHTLLKELNLLPGEDIPHPVHLSPLALERKPTCGGITLHQTEEIFIEHPFSQKKGVQTELTSEEIRKLEERLEELEIKSADLEKLKNIWQNKYLGEKKNNNQEFQDQITELIQERDNYQNKWDGAEEELNQRDNEITRLRNEVKRIERERDNRLNINITVEQWNNDYSQRPTRSQLDSVRQQLNNSEKEKNDLRRRLEEAERRATNSYSNGYSSRQRELSRSRSRGRRRSRDLE